MQRTIREVKCDRCNLTIKDYFTGFKTRRLAGRMYDLCKECYTIVEKDLLDYEFEVTNYFVSREGRPIEEGDM